MAKKGSPKSKDSKKVKKDKKGAKGAKEPKDAGPPPPPPPPKPLPINPLRILDQLEEKRNPLVPPSTPPSVFSFEFDINLIPKQFPEVDKLNVPNVRKVGIRTCLGILADFFDCKDYEYNLIQFWFVDIIANCLLRIQDVFQFPIEYQKIILKWFLYVFDLIRAQHVNFSRRELLDVFYQATLVLEEHVLKSSKTDLSIPIFPPPEDIFTPILKGKNSHSSATLSSFKSSASTSQSSFSLPSQVTDPNATIEFYKSPPCRWRDSDTTIISELIGENYEDELEPELIEEDDGLFLWRPDPNMPARFLSLFGDSDIGFEYTDEEETKSVMRSELFEYKLWDRGLSDIFCSTDSRYSLDFNRCSFDFNVDDNRARYNCCALLAIKKLIAEHLYDNFQFSLIKFALRTDQSIPTKKINEMWSIPKLLGETPKETKGKKGKVKGKGKGKGSKGSDKKSKSSGKKSKDSAKSKGKRGKSETKTVEPDPEPEIDWAHMFLRPLSEGVDEEFFKTIFENFGKGGKGKGKGKGKKKK